MHTLMCMLCYSYSKPNNKNKIITNKSIEHDNIFIPSPPGPSRWRCVPHDISPWHQSMVEAQQYSVPSNPQRANYIDVLPHFLIFPHTHTCIPTGEGMQSFHIFEGLRKFGETLLGYDLQYWLASTHLYEEILLQNLTYKNANQKGYVLGTLSKVVVGLSQVNPRSLPQDWTPASPEERHSGSAQDVGIRMEPITHCSSSSAAPFNRLESTIPRISKIFPD